MRIAITCFVLLSFIFIGIATKTPSPLLAWSGKKLFTKQKVLLGRLNTNEFINTLEAISGLKDKKESKINLQKVESPEVIAFFLKPKLSNSEFSRLANVYSSDRNGGSLSNLMTLIDNSESSLSVHYSFKKISFIEDVISKLSKDILSKSEGASIVVSSERRSDIPLLVGNHGKWLSLDHFEDYISSEEGRKLMSNGKTDVIVYYLSEEINDDKVSQEDRAIGRISRVIEVATNGNFFSVFSSDMASKKRSFDPIQSFDIAPQKRLPMNMPTNMNSNSSVEIAGTYFPAPIWESIFSVIILLIAMMIGSYCISGIQVPPKLLDEAMAKKET